MDRELGLSEHLGELRKRLIICLVSLGIGIVCSMPFAQLLLRVLKFPAAGLIEKLVFFSPQEAFLIYMRIAFFCGLSFSMPVILYQLWSFVSPAMDERLKRYSNDFIIGSSFLFFIRFLFSYYLLIPPALKFLLSFASEDLEPVISATKYISFVLSLIFGCGLVFLMPILSLIFTKLGLINARVLRRKYKYALVIILIVSAIITPTPDAFNMCLLALPMLFLYELSIWISFFARPRTKAV